LPLVFRVVQDEGYRPVQCLNYFAHAFYFVFFWFEGGVLSSAAVDIIFEHRRSGLVSLSGQELVTGREKVRDFWFASPATEFTYLLAKRTWKGYADSRQVRRLGHLVEQLGTPRAEELAGKIFLGKLKARVVDACANGSIDELLREIGTQPWCTSLARHPLGLVRFVCGEALRVTRRWFHPTGLFVVILGPDGVGKSTLVGRLSQEFGPCFRRHRIFHWRPMVIAAQKETGAVVSDPHGVLPRGTLRSVAVLLGFFLDYWVGYCLVLRPFLARSGLVMFDRYFHDLLVDPLRYRYGGPMWLARLLGRFVPPPDLMFLVLDAEDQVIFTRKREVPPEELRRQRAGYQQFITDERRAALITTDKGVEPTLKAATRLVVEYLAERFERQNVCWLARAD
jgi:thymidylate kinase